MLCDNVGRLAKLYRCLEFPFGGDDLRTALTLGLGFLRHRALHIVWEHNVLYLDCRYLSAPRFRMPVNNVLNLLVDARGVREKLIEAKSSDNVAHSGLADLVDRIVDIFDHDYCFFWI